MNLKPLCIACAALLMLNAGMGFAAPIAVCDFSIQDSSEKIPIGLKTEIPDRICEKLLSLGLQCERIRSADSARPFFNWTISGNISFKDGIVIYAKTIPRTGDMFERQEHSANDSNALSLAIENLSFKIYSLFEENGLKRVYVFTDPDSVAVTSDGSPLGVTPIEALLFKGQHEFTLKKKGYYPLSKIVFVDRDLKCLFQMNRQDTNQYRDIITERIRDPQSKKAATAFYLSLFVPGTGQWYAGSPISGTVHFFGGASIWFVEAMWVSLMIAAKRNETHLLLIDPGGRDSVIYDEALETYKNAHQWGDEVYTDMTLTVVFGVIGIGFNIFSALSAREKMEIINAENKALSMTIETTRHEVRLACRYHF